MEAGADNVESDEGSHYIYTQPDDFAAVMKALEEKLGEAQKAELTWIANVEKDLGAEEAESVVKLFDALEELDDVQYVYSNFTASDEVLERLTD